MDPFGLTPEEEQRIAAETLRSQKVLGGAQQRGGRFDNLAAISMLANNKAAAEAAQAAQGRAVARSKPAQLGNSGFMVDGEFAANPAYIQEKLEGRAQQRGLSLERAQAAAAAQRERLDAQAQQNGLNRSQVAAQAEQNRSLRLALGEGKADKGADKKEKDVEKLLPQFGDRAQKLKLPRLMQSAQELEDVLDNADAKGTDVPGIGYGSVALSKTPILGQKVLGDDGMLNRANVQQLANALLAADSGMAVTLSEEQRATISNMASGTYGEKQTRDALRNIVLPLVNDVRANLMSSYPPEVINEYNKRYATVGGSRDWTKPLRLKGRKVAEGKVTEGVPAGVDPEDWKFMTPAEKKLFGGVK